MKKNSQIHLYLETELLERLKSQARENGLSVAEICRRKLRSVAQLNRIEEIILEVNRKLNNCKEVKKW